MNIMSFREWNKGIKESVKEVELDRILDLITLGSPLSSREKKFLNDYNNINSDEMKDLSHLSKDVTVIKISDLLENGKKVICDLYDRNGKISTEIENINHDAILFLKNKEVFSLHDRFLYNLVYDISKDQYSLQSQDEYFEEVPITDQ